MNPQEPIIGAPGNNSEPIYINVYDSNNKPRLWCAQQSLNEILNNLDPIDYTQLVSAVVVAYEKWVNYNEWLIFYNNEINKTIAVKCRKRGNDIYLYAIKKKLEGIIDFVKEHDVKFFEWKKDIHVSSPLVFVTLTYKHDNFIEDWKNAGKEFNRFMSRLRKRFGDIKVLGRSFEAHSDGYIHIHALLFFDYPLPGKRHVNAQGKITYRLRFITPFKNAWKEGFSDFQLVDSLSHGLFYLMKYMLKQDDQGKHAKLTFSLSWIFRKREFSLNYKAIWELITTYKDQSQFNEKNRLDYTMRNSNRDTSKSAWIFVGVVAEVGLAHEWFIEYSGLFYLSRF